MDGPQEGPRTFVTTPDDHSGIALTVGTIFATWTVLCFIVRCQQRLTVSGPFGWDDIVCAIASVFAVAQTITVGVAISFGFGKKLELLTVPNALRAEKAIYAAQLLYIITNALTKASVALLFARLMFIKQKVKVAYGIAIVAGLWGIASFITEAALCHQPWNLTPGHTCHNKVRSWEAITAFNIAIELALAAMPVWLVWDLKQENAQKWTIVTIFWLRLPVIAAAIARIRYLATSISSDQPLFAGVPPFICLQLEMQYGLMSAMFPCLKLFVTSFNTGWGTYDPNDRHGYGGGSARRQNGSRSSFSRSNQSNRSRRSNEGDLRATRGGPPPDDSRVTQIRGGGDYRPRSSGRRSMESSLSSQGIIRQTFEISQQVQYDDNPGPSMTPEPKTNPFDRSILDD